MAKIESGRVRQREGNLTGIQPTVPQTILEMVTATPGVPSSLKGVLFGPPKTGKTTAACSGGSTLLINFDPEGYATETLAGRTDIDVVEPQTAQEVNQILVMLLSDMAQPYEFVVIDSVTFMFQKFDHGRIAQDFMDNKDIRRAYGMAGAACQQVIHDLAMLPETNVIFTAHLQKEHEQDSVRQDQELGEHEVSIAVTPMVWKILGPAVGFIGRTFKRGSPIIAGGNTQSTFYVSFNDGARSPAGSRYAMEAEYLITDTLLSDLATDLLRR